MKAKDFIEMQRQDIETHKDKLILSEVVKAMEEILRNNPERDVDAKKTAEECYKQMYEHAKKNQANNAYVFTTEGTLEFIRGYLGVTDAVGGAEKKRRSLEDFF